MNKGIYFLLVLIGLTSCTQDVVFNNNAAFQGVKDNIAWRAADARASVNPDTSINIEALTINETLTLNIPFPTTFVNQKIESTYIEHKLEEDNNVNVAYSIFLNGASTDYETDSQNREGLITITDYDGQTISGTFWFNVKNTDSESEEAKIVNFQYGNFYKVPIIP